MTQIISVLTMPGPEDCHTRCPRCGVAVIAHFTPKVTLKGAASAWTVRHSEPQCRDEALDRIDWSSEDIDWSPVHETDDWQKV